MAFDIWPGFYPAHLASETGLLDSLGVQLELSVPQNTARVLTDFAAHRYDLVAASVADMFAVMQREPGVQVLFCTDESAGADAIVSSTLRSASELRGRRIGVKLGGFAELLVRRMLDSAGIELRAVDLVDIDASDVPGELAAGRIDAGETWEPYLTEMRRDGYRELFSSAQEPGLIVECVFAHDDVVIARREELHALTDAWFRAQAQLLADPKSSLPIVARALALPESTLSTTGVRFLDRDENRRRFAAAPGARSLATTFADYEKFFGSLGRLRVRVDVARVINQEFVR